MNLNAAYPIGTYGYLHLSGTLCAKVHSTDQEIFSIVNVVYIHVGGIKIFLAVILLACACGL